ncbi:MAG TPA: class I SAM-dependent methyltransferase [Gaiellaceae bacterium]|nr:class I SAM-dependent methyltransferase [Gaiellaceae bacterium]
MSGPGHWERHAEQWAAWARRPDFDGYWRDSRPPFFELVPPARGRALELGCGEGRVTRDLAARGHEVVGVDVGPTCLGLAQEADQAGEYVLSDAARLPFGDATFDLVVAFNSLMDIDDMPGAISEAARVLTEDGRFCICITHPMRDAGRFDARGRDAPLVIRGTYFGKRRFEDTVARGGLEMHFRSWAYPLQDYVRALVNAGFAIEALREPPDPDRPVPNFLLLRALKA